jgi:hypothetical protein
MDTKLKIIFGLAIVLAFVLGLIVGKANTVLLIIAGIGIIAAFIGGLLVYRNNAKKFNKLVDKATTDPTIAALLAKV